MFRRKKGLWIVLALLAVACGGGYYYYNVVYLPAQVPEEPPIQTATVRRGDLVISATGVGTVMAATEVDLRFHGSGVLAELNVQVGDEVHAGDVLARLDDTDAQQAVSNAELQVAKARLDLATAQNQLEKLLEGSSKADMLDAQAGVKSAEEIQDRELALSKAKNSLWSAQASRDSTCGRVGKGGSAAACDSANAQVANAESSVRQAEIALATPQEPATQGEIQDKLSKVAQAQERLAELREGPTEAEIAQAEAQLAKDRLEELREGPSEAQIAQADGQLAQAEERLEDLYTAPFEGDIANSGAQVEKTRLSLVQAELNLESARRSLEQMTLVAPMDGTVMSVAAHVGENLGNAALITLVDLAQPLIEIYLDETDLDKIGVGYEVEVVLDALPDDTLMARVVRIEPSVERVEGVQAMRALVGLDEESFGNRRTLPTGLSATVEVISDRAEGALLVPVESVPELDPGECAVSAVEDGKPRLRGIEVGLVDLTYAEVLSGLRPGGQVTTGIVEAK